MKGIKAVTAGNQKVTIRPWADGKVLLMSADEAIKSEWIRIRAEENGILELLTDPDIRVASEDLDGVMFVVADPDRMCMVYDLVKDRLTFAECVAGREEDLDDTGGTAHE